MWKNDRFFEERKKAFTPKIAAALLKHGKVKIKGLFSPKTGKTYDGTVLLADTGGKYVNFRMGWIVRISVSFCCKAAFSVPIS